MLNDLTALTPPFLMCAAFLFGVGAFLRHEMRRAKNSSDEDDSEDSDDVSTADVTENPVNAGAKAQAVSDQADEGDTSPRA
jgi:hypothetical protein